jgi:hypothetical protein
MGHTTSADQAAFSVGFDPETMAQWVMQFSPATDAEALKLLRSRFPDRPLSLRVAALDFLMRRAAVRAD